MKKKKLIYAISGILFLIFCGFGCQKNNPKQETNLTSQKEIKRQSGIAVAPLEPKETPKLPEE